jgi:thiol-disulfide isomerase/thioredoxin
MVVFTTKIRHQQVSQQIPHTFVGVSLNIMHTLASIRLIFLLLALGLSPLSSSAAFVSAQFQNTVPGTDVVIWVPQRYLDGQDLRIRSILDAQSRMAVEVNILEPQLVFVLFNDDRLPLFLSPGDTLLLRADAFQFPLGVQFSGNAGNNNRFLQTYLRKFPADFNEFNNIRFKIGQHWASVESAINKQMDELPPAAYREYCDSLRSDLTAFCEQAEGAPFASCTPFFALWVRSEITYFWAYNLLVYGHVYGQRYGIQADFFDFMYEAPLYSEFIGNDWYRSFLQAAMARRQVKINPAEAEFWTGMYAEAGRLLSGKPLAFLRSEIISTAFSTEKSRGILPLYNDFLQHNEYPVFDGKIEGLYQKYSRAMPGTAAPSFEALDWQNMSVSSSQLRGKVVYLNFWATWCSACIRKMEILDQSEPEFALKGIEIVNISLDENREQWRSALLERGFKGRHLLSTAGPGRNLAQLFGVEAVPQYFIIDRKGNFAEKANSSHPLDIRAALLEVAKR